MWDVWYDYFLFLCKDADFLLVGSRGWDTYSPLAFVFGKHTAPERPSEGAGAVFSDWGFGNTGCSALKTSIVYHEVVL